MSLSVALGSLVNIRQFFVWRLSWDGAKGKYEKHPCTPAGPWIVDASKPHNWLSYADAAAQLAAYPVDPAGHTRYALGFWLTAECGYWFLDLDKCVTHAGAYTPIATELCAQLPGCFFEFSSSGTGVHIIGRGTVPAHSMRNKQHGLELYTEQRGIAFGTSGVAYGNADVGSPAIASIAAQYFPPRAAGEAGDYLTPRADWSGPADDDALIAKMLASTSTAARMGNRASFAMLWGNAPELDKFYGPDTASERDAALAAHLAFWTGCDAPRMERLMRRSALARDKWDEHRTYLRELTIEGACARQTDVYRETVRKDPAALYQFAALPALPVIVDGAGHVAAPITVTPMVSDEAKATIDRLLDMVSASTSWEDVHNRVIPAVRAAGVPPALMSRLENAINKRLDLWDAKLPVSKLRTLINPPKAADGDNSRDAPEWVKNYVYVEQGDRFHDLTTGVGVSRTTFSARHNRQMPVKGDGPLREDAVMWALDRWNVEMVHASIYYPGMPSIVAHDRLQWANEYVESSHPPVEEYTAQGVAAINQFRQHLLILCNGRLEVAETILAFMAHNVQKPGVKIRWCPIIKGTQGDGKSTIGSALDAAMGGRNVAMIGPDVVCNNGGFTDWAHGTAVVALEELHMAGKDRHRVANTIKPFVTNNKVSINGKGDKPKNVPNTCNQIAFTNNGDAVPIESGQDRRWLVIFTPFADRQALNHAIGCSSDVEAEKHFDRFYDSFKREPGQWRKWLLEYPIPSWFSPNRAAMDTEEKESMAQNGMDDAESVARSIVAEGCYGVTTTVLSSSCLTRALTMRALAEGFDVPKGPAVAYMLQRMGFQKVPNPLKWGNATHRIVTRPGVSISPDNLRKMLDDSTTTKK